MHISVNAITNCFRIPFQPSQATFTEIGLPACSWNIQNNAKQTKALLLSQSQHKSYNLQQPALNNNKNDDSLYYRSHATSRQLDIIIKYKGSMKVVIHTMAISLLQNDELSDYLPLYNCIVLSISIYCRPVLCIFQTTQIIYDRYISSFIFLALRYWSM